VSSVAERSAQLSRADGDTNPRRRDSERARALAELSHSLAAAIDDVPGVLNGVVQLVSNFLGDTAVIRLVDAAGDTVSVVAVGDPDPSVRTTVTSIVTASPTNLHEIEPWAHAIREARSIELTGGDLAQATRGLPLDSRRAIKELDITATLICPLRSRGQVIGTLGLWRRGDKGEHSPRDQAFAQELADRAALAIDNARLVQRLRAEVEERKRNEENLQLSSELLHRADEKRRALISNLVSVEEEQRRRIAVDVHDDSIQAMAAIGLRLQVMRRHAPTPDLAKRIAEIEETVVSSISRLRQLLVQLDSPSVEEGGLARALSHYMDELFADGTPKTSFRTTIVVEPPAQTRTILYRIAQEALNNVRKHARATKVSLVLSPLDNGVLVTIQDDGIGFNADDVSKRSLPGHLGLRSMVERATMAEGWLTVDSGHGAGTTLRLWLPILDSPADL
jgi:signal transduction histidine kinase